MIRRCQSSGFTLVELLFSIAVGAIILFAAVSFMGSSAEGYARVGGNVANERESRFLLTEITSELDAALFHKDMRIESAQAGWARTHFGFLTLRPADAQSVEDHIGDLCAVHYYLKDIPMGGRSVRCVMRGFRDSKQTFQALRENKVGDLFTVDDMADEPIALRALSFEVDPLVLDADGKWIEAPLPLTAAPAAIRVRLVVVRPSLAGRLATSADWDGTTAMAARTLGNPDEARNHPDLQVFESILPFRSHEIR